LTPKIRELITTALNIVDDMRGIDLKKFDTNRDGFIDSITFVHSGYGAEWGGTDQYGRNSTDRIWSHKWTFGWKSKMGVKVDMYHLSTSLYQTSGSKIAHIGVVSHEIGHSFGLEDLYE
jgi:M6 family metalloprotease-like protein